MICEADGNPTDYSYEWDFKSENETEPKDLKHQIKGKISILILEDSPYRRTYICRADNSVGPGQTCEMTVEGILLTKWFCDNERFVLLMIRFLFIRQIIVVSTLATAHSIDSCGHSPYLPHWRHNSDHHYCLRLPKKKEAFE